MADFQQETQVSPKEAFPNGASVPSLPASTASLDDGYHLNNDDAYDARPCEEEVQEVVEDTQLEPLEVDTQAQDSFVPETQFDPLEKDTQAIDEPINFPASQPTKAQFEPEDNSFLRRPELPDISNAQDGFKFIPAQPRTQNPFKRPQVRPVGAAIASKASSLPESTPGLNETNSDIKTQQRIAEKPHSSHNANCSFNTSQKPAKITVEEPAPHDSPSTLRVSGQHRQGRIPCQTTATMAQSANLDKNHSNKAYHDAQDTMSTEKVQMSAADLLKLSHSPAGAKLVQKNSSKGRQRIKKQPFPEARHPEESRRWGTKSANKSDSTDLYVRSGTPSNTERVSVPVKDDDTNEASNRGCEASTTYSSGPGDTEIIAQSSTVMEDEEDFVTGPDFMATKSTLVSSKTTTPSVLEVSNRFPVNDNALRHARPEETAHSSLPSGTQSLPTASATVPQKKIPLQQNEVNGSPAQRTGDAIQLGPATLRPDGEQSEYIQNATGTSATHLPSQNTSKFPSQPQSQHGYQSNTMARPLSAHELTLADATIPRSTQAIKVKKTNRTNKQNASNRLELSKQQNVRGLESLVRVHQQTEHEILQSFQERDEIIQSKQTQIEEQEACITAQKAEIERQIFEIQAQKSQIEALQKQMEHDKKTLAPKYQKIMEQSQKYAKHANDMAAAQNWLKNAAETIKKTTDEVLKRTNKVLLASDISDKRTADLQDALRTSKEIRLMAQTLEIVKKEKKELIIVNNKLTAYEKSSKEKLEAFEKQLQELSAAYTNQTSEKAALEIEVENLKVETKDATKHNTLLQESLDERLIDLATERHNNEQIQKSLEKQTTALGKLLEAIKEVPTETVEILTGNDGTLGKLLASENTTREKFQDLTSVLKEYMEHEPELPPAVMKLIQDVALRLEGEKQRPESNGTNPKDVATSIVQELKETLDQLRLDKKTEIRLNSKIAELEHERESLSTLNVARNTEVNNLSRQSEELRRELMDCRRDLSNKNNELAAALNAPREDPLMRDKVSELENAKTMLEQQVNKNSQEIMKVKEDLTSSQKTATRKEEEAKVLAGKLSNAQQTIKSFNESKAQALAQQNEAHKKTCQEIVKNMESQKATIKLKLESEVKTYEVREKNQAEEIATLKEQLQSVQAAAQNNSSAAQVLLYEEQMKQLITEWQHLRQDSGNTHDDNGVLSKVKSLQEEIADLKLGVQSAAAHSAEAIKIATREQGALEELLRKVDDTKQKKTVGTEQENIFTGFHQAQSKAPPGVQQSQQHPSGLTRLRAASNFTGIEDDMLLGDGMKNTPAKQAFRQSSSIGNGSPLTKQTATTGTKLTGDFALSSTIPSGAAEGQAHRRISQNLLQQDGNSRGLGLLPRGTNSPANSIRRGLQYAQSLLLDTDTPRFPSKDTSLVGHKPTTIRFDDSTKNNNHPVPGTPSQKGCSDKRSRNDDSLTPDGLGFANQGVFPKQVVHPGDEQAGHHPTHSIISQNKAPTVVQESRAGRTSQQLKSAMKKSTARNNALSSEPSKPIATEHGPARLTRSNSGRGRSQASAHPLDNIRGVVSGRQSDSRGEFGLQAGGDFNQGTSASSHLFDPQLSPPMDAPMRNRNKRPAATILQSSKPKVARLRQTSTQTTIPESQ